MNIEQPFVTQEQKFKYWEESKAEIQTLRAKVASAEVLVESLREAVNLQYKHYGDGTSLHISMIFWARDTNIKLATYDKLSEVKHDTK